CVARSIALPRPGSCSTSRSYVWRGTWDHSGVWRPPEADPPERTGRQVAPSAAQHDNSLGRERDRSSYPRVSSDPRICGASGRHSFRNRNGKTVFRKWRSQVEPFLGCYGLERNALAASCRTPLAHKKFELQISASPAPVSSTPGSPVPDYYIRPARPPFAGVRQVSGSHQNA